MPELNWVGKDKVVTHHMDVPYRVLDRQYSFDTDGQHEADNGSPNMIIHGDNLEALKALLPQYEGKVDCIYIDPPYNTGNEGWVYNDNVNDPRIKKWLGDVVGKEGEDLSRHDKWLCMMYPRLRLLSRLLAPTGTMVISLSHHELPYLMVMLEEIFGTRQVVLSVVQTSGGKPKQGFNLSNEYLVFVAPQEFCPNPSTKGKTSYASAYHGMNLATFNQSERPNQAYPIYVDNSGAVVGVGLSLQERLDAGLYEGALSDFRFDWDEAPEGTAAVWPVTAKGVPCVWRLIPQRLMSDWAKGYIKVVPSMDKTRNAWSVQYLSGGIISKIESREFQVLRWSEDPEIPTLEVQDYTTEAASVPTMWLDKDFFTTRGGEQITDIFGSKSAFDYPKPVELVKDVITRVSGKEALVLDSFAGSGTTAQAVLEANAADGGRRTFILIELGGYADAVTAKRTQEVVRGYKRKNPIKEVVFERHLTPRALVDAPSFLDEAEEALKECQLSGRFQNVGKPQIVVNPEGKPKGAYLCVIGTRTTEATRKGTGGSFSFYELGEQLLVDGDLNPAVPIERVREYVWFTETQTPWSIPAVPECPSFLGIYRDTAYHFIYEPNTATTLGRSYLASLNPETIAGALVVYADTCTLSAAELSALNVTFKKIPRDITKL